VTNEKQELRQPRGLDRVKNDTQQKSLPVSTSKDEYETCFIQC